MNTIVAYLDIETDDKIVLNNNDKYSKKKIFKKDNIINAFYKYWIEYRIDEGRYYYGEFKPIEDISINNDGNISSTYHYELNYIHTKNGILNSIKILRDMKERVEMLKKNYKVNYGEIDDISIQFYKNFDKDKIVYEGSTNKPNNKGYFTNNLITE